MHPTGGDRVLDLKVVQIDIYECCLQHDIDLWCSDSSSRPNNMAIMCVASKVVEKIINSPFPLNMLYWLALSPILMSFEILAHIVFEILGLGGVWKYPELGGGRGWSCLCGGDEQTYCCDPGRNPDLCYNKFGQLKPLCRDKCFNCYWTCMYDNFGNPLFDSRGRQVREQITDPSGKLHCCLGTPGDKYAKPCRV